jgi:hypothetical protein
MASRIANLISQLTPDDWRIAQGFTEHISEANEKLLHAEEAKAESILNEWIRRHQPCLFGRIAAKLGLLSYCILTEYDLAGSDEDIRDKIQQARTVWTREAFEGKKSGFVILAVSPRIIEAVPSVEMGQLAQLLSSFYLLTEIEPDQIYLEDVFLEKPGTRRTTWKWHAGVNYFCAQGDLRWWQDHRIPGGMAFSVNSVGHMVKSHLIAKSMRELEELLDAPEEGWITSNVDSLPKALVLAMRTIANASETNSGKATQLLDIPSDRNALPVQTCPVELPRDLSNKNFCQYMGYYHTDYTIPSEYFSPEVERPVELGVRTLDFTYLFDRSIENPDFVTMGEGQQIRLGQEGQDISVNLIAAIKKLKGFEEEVPIHNNQRLMESLKG